MHGGQVQIFVRPVPTDLDLFAIVQPAQLGRRRRQEIRQGVQVRQPLGRGAEQLGVNLLQLAQLLLVQLQLVPGEIALVPFALGDLRVELIDHFVLVLVAFQFHLGRR